MNIVRTMRLFRLRFACPAILSILVARAAVAAPPNVVLILADDLGWSDLGCYGADLHETPNIDRFASGAVRFTQAYSAPVCSPTRAAIMTGKHPARLHMTIWYEGTFQTPRNRRLIPPPAVADLPLAEITLAERLRDAGYKTAHVGKWHLGGAPHYPETQGFDVNIGGTFYGAPASYFHPYRTPPGNPGEVRYVPGLGFGKPGQHLGDRLTDEALRILDEVGEEPFFLNLWYHDVHTPMDAKTELIEKYKRKRRPDFRHQNPNYAAMIETLDANVGRVLGKLQDRGLADKTIVIFTSDNGGYTMENRGMKVTTNAPLRSGKGSVYEGGVRVPMIVRAPSGARSGAVCDDPVASMDLLPTVMDLVGRPSSSANGEALDGRSFASLLAAPREKLPARNLYFHYPHYYPTTTPVSAIRSGEWKLIEYFEDSRVELYHLADDLGESKDRAQSDPVMANQLRALLHAWRRDVGARTPTVNAAVRP